MAARKAGQRNPSSTDRSPAPRRPRRVWFGLVAAASIIGLVACGGSAETTGQTAAAGLKQTRPVQVSGSPLPELKDGAGDPAVGTTAPEVRGTSFDGTPVAITHDGRPRLILFVAHWCPHCQREVPLLVDHLSAHPLPDGIALVAVATSTVSNRPNYPPSEWLAKERWRAPVLADSDKGDAATAFGLSAFPYFVALDGSGKVVARTSGEISTEQFSKLAQQALGR